MSTGKIYYVKNKGRIHGPYALSQLKGGLSQAKLSRAHMVSADRTNWTALGELLEQLEAAANAAAEEARAAAEARAAVGTGTAPTQSAPASITLPTSLPDQSGMPDLSQVNGNLMAAGIAVTVCMLIPVVWSDDSGVVWTWSGLSAMSRSLGFLLVFILLSGIACIVLSAAVRGIARPIAVLSIWVVGLIVVVGASGQLLDLPPGGDSFTVLLSVLFLSLCITVAVLLRWRAGSPTMPRRVVTCALSSCLALLSVIYVIGFIINSPLDGLDRLEQLTGPVRGSVYALVTAMILAVLTGIGFAIASGIIGILQVKPTALASPTRIGATLAHLAPLIILTSVILGMWAESVAWYPMSNSSMVITTVLISFHLIVIPIALLEIFYEGLRELLTGISMKSKMLQPAVATRAVQPLDSGN